MRGIRGEKRGRTPFVRSTRRAVPANEVRPLFPPRSGLSLLEVLVSLFILAVGLLSVAALIPVGKLALIKTNKSDRTGACGRAGLSEVRIRRMLDPDMWAANPGNGTFAIDPLGYIKLGNSSTLGPLNRINLFTTPNAATAEAIFSWHDDLTFDIPDDSSNRPTALSIGEFDGHFSWFITATPSPADVANGVPVVDRRSYNVSVVVCHRRTFIEAERTANAAFSGGVGYGGGTITLDNSTGALPLVVKENEWILLYSPTTYQCAWYRAVSSVTIDPGGSGWLSIVGPDWHGGAAQAVIIPGVSGVYSTTVRVD